MSMNNQKPDVVFPINYKDNSGEQIIITTWIMDNGDGNEDGIFLNHEIQLNSYCNSASIQLSGAQLTPELLRKLANEIEIAYNKKLAQIIKSEKS